MCRMRRPCRVPFIKTDQVSTHAYIVELVAAAWILYVVFWYAMFTLAPNYYIFCINAFFLFTHVLIRMRIYEENGHKQN